jgi:hypothetical protein
MLISFYGTLSGLTANILKDEAKIGVACKVEEMDEDALDRLAEVCALQIASDVHLVFEGNQLALPCRVGSVMTDHAKKDIKIVIVVPEKRLDAKDKSCLEEWYRMEREIGVEVTNRQMTFKDIVPQGLRGRVDKVTISSGNKSVTFDKSVKIDPETGEVQQ